MKRVGHSYNYLPMYVRCLLRMYIRIRNVCRSVCMYVYIYRCVCLCVFRCVSVCMCIDTCADTGGVGDREPPYTAVCNFVLLVDLPRALQQFGSAPEIPVRTPPPLLNVRTPPPPLLNPGSAPVIHNLLYMLESIPGPFRYTCRHQ